MGQGDVLKSYDVIIVGAGVMGLMAARDLAQAGKEILLIDKAAAGAEASWAGGGIISPLYPWRYDSAVTALAVWSQSFYPELALRLLNETGIDIECYQSGLLMMNVQDQHKAFDWAQTYQRDIRTLSASDIAAIEPHVQRQAHQEGIYLPQVSNVRNPRLLKAILASLAKEKNVTLLTNNEVIDFVTSGDKVTAVVTKDAKYHAQTVVVTCGAWTSQLLKQLNYHFPIKPFKGEMLLYKTERAGKLINSIVLSEGKYLIPRQDGHIVVGSTLEDVGFNKTLTNQGRVTLQDAAESIVPALAALPIIKQWSGLRPGSPRGVPLIGRLLPYTNMFINAGQFRNGLVLAPASTHILVNLILNQEPMIAHSAYEPARYLPRHNADTFLYY